MDESLVVQRPLPVESPLHQIDKKFLELWSMEHLERALDDTQFQVGYQICGNLSIGAERKLLVCSNPAGGNTQHPGVGRCSRHEGAQLARSPYATAIRGYESLAQIYEAMQQREKKLNDLSEEISIARTALHLLLSYLEANKRSANRDLIKEIILCLEQVRRTAHSMALIQQSESQGITEPAIRGFLWQIGTIIEDEVFDASVRIRIMDRIATEARFVER